MRKLDSRLVLLPMLLICGCVAAPRPVKPAPTSSEILDATTAADWQDLDPGQLIYFDLAGERRFIVQLADSLAPAASANVRALVRAGFFDGLTVSRVQDNFVAQWGASRDTALPGGAEAHPVAEFDIALDAGMAVSRLTDADGYAPATGFLDGFPVGVDFAHRRIWGLHCYGAVGVGRDNPPDAGNGTELYAVIGQAPRQLDRNITVVGRVVQGIEVLAALTRGPPPMGFYTDAGQATVIERARVAADVLADERIALQRLDTRSAAFDAYVESRRNRRDPWYLRPANHIDVCNVSVPVRVRPSS
ncbi:MAG: peptidylprolyl isomerase [Steroidobacteraceae bacterium]